MKPMTKNPKHLVVSIAIAAVALAAGGASSAAQLVKNGGFERGSFKNWMDQSTLPDYVTTSNGAIVPIQGSYFAVVGGTGTGSYPNGSLAQVIHDGGGAVDGHFFLNFDDATKSDIFTVRWDGSNVETIKCTASGRDKCGVNKWVRFNLDLTGHGTDPLSFNFKTAGGSNIFALDDISLTGIPAVPEPATWGLMLLGLAGVGGALRSRRKGAVAAA
jgi:hypothetical protein